MKMKNRILYWIVLIFVIMTTSSAAETAIQGITAGITGINAYGEVYLDITCGELTSAGFEAGDLVSVSMSGKMFDIVISDQYCLVPANDCFLDLQDEEDPVIIEGSMVSFVEKMGIADRVDDEYGKTTWYLRPGTDLSTVHITLLQKEYDPIIAFHPALKRTSDRTDYSSDEVFANFREVTAGKIVPGTLYRSCSPGGAYPGRSETADRLCSEAGIHTILNLCDREEELAGLVDRDHFPFYSSKIEQGQVIAGQFREDFTNPYEMRKLGRALTELARSDPPWLIHCVEGKDRTGFVLVLLESLMGATRTEIEADYVQSFINYFHLENEPELCGIIASRMVSGMLEQIGDAAMYIKQCGVDEKDTETIMKKLVGKREDSLPENTGNEAPD